MNAHRPPIHDSTTMPMISRRSRKALSVLFLPLIAGCAQQPSTPVGQPPATEPPKAAVPEAAAAGNGRDDNAKIYRGTGLLVGGQETMGAVVPRRPPPPGGPVVLNFEGADLREVVRNILGDILNQPYTIDPNVGGQVTIRTASGIPRDALPATLETLLRMNGATMVREGNLWKVMPQTNAVRGNVTPQLGDSTRPLPPGYSVQIVPLKYIGVRDMLRILEPFAKDAQAVRPDELRNLLILSGTETELRHLMDTIDMFDIDWMSGMSAGIFTLRNADVKTVSQELDKVLGDKNTSPFTGILRIIPIERMNALLVISPNAQYIDEAKKWIERLDSGSGESARFFVYNLQNQRAERVGPLLQQAFTGRTTQPGPSAAPTLAPGTPAGEIVSPPSFMQQPTIAPNTPAASALPAAIGAAAGAAAGVRAVTGEGGGIVRNIQVVADKDQNTLLIVATPSEFSIIEAALKKLDVASRQVMIEVTIAEVTLNDSLTFGVEWLFKGGAPSGRGSGGFFAPGGTPAFNPAVPVASAVAAVGLGIAQGFSYIINNANFPGGVQAVLRLLDTYGNTKVVANPHVAALDNQKATIKSGERIPINQQTFLGTGTGVPTNAVTTTSQYIDTGVLLQVTPHINAGGLVSLDVQAEVSNPGTLVPNEAPPINTRSVQTYVSVQSGQTMIMGGLISDARQNASEGLPLLSRIPILGGLFGSQQLKNSRTELVLFITPRVVENEVDIRGAIDDLRRKMENMDAFLPLIRPIIGPVFPGATVNPGLAPFTTQGFGEVAPLPRPLVSPEEQR